MFWVGVVIGVIWFVMAVTKGDGDKAKKSAKVRTPKVRMPRVPKGPNIPFV